MFIAQACIYGAHLHMFSESSNDYFGAIAQYSTFLEQKQSHSQEIQHLQLLIERYRRMIFGKSEKLRPHKHHKHHKHEDQRLTNEANENRPTCPTRSRDLRNWFPGKKSVSALIFRP
jgi:hypothetical protein